MRKTASELWKDRERKFFQLHEALKRNQRYKDDFMAAFQEYATKEGLTDSPELRELFINSSPQGIQLARRYRLKIPWDPEGERSPQFKEEAVMVIRCQDESVKDTSVTLDTIQLQRHNKEGRFLLVEIDCHRHKGEIVAELESILDIFNYHDGRPDKAKGRGVAIDSFPFEVYDMHKEGKTTWQITKERFPETKGKSPNDYSKNFSQEAKSCLRQVERALKKARDLINATNPTD